MRCTPMRYTPMTYTPVRCTPVRYTPIRCTLVGCMPVRYVLIFENSLVVLDAEPGLAVMSGSAAAVRAEPSPKLLRAEIAFRNCVPDTFRLPLCMPVEMDQER